ncbi:54K polar flagellar sheath protein A [Vibrio nigripulchritudo ATCC 27043]|uniref:hypothetical protein n=1 Tax=Vibrio nigripulchritudo TaxID=28173 RepID=UPI00021C1F4F|nr:hypothetical protein [Vibrio nigripulchritudo]EGU59317.1 54K polar flagellar sheath protein A [Vibrio nigripulchritudo ATCC 27043]
MTKFKFSVVALATAVILSGCGSESKSSTGSNSKPPTPPAPTPTPPPAPTIYNWQLVNLRSEVPSSANADCAVYAVDTNDSSKRIYAYRATQNVVISIHNSVGKLVKELAPNAYGTVSINYDDIPTNGYVTVEEVDGLIGSGRALYSYSVEKPFVNNMVFNLRKPGAYSCYYTGEGLPASVTPDANAGVTVNAPATKYVQSSYIDKGTSGAVANFPNKIPVIAPIPATEKILLTQYETYTSSQALDLRNYAFVGGDFAHNQNTHPDSKTVTLSDTNLVQPGLSFTDLTLSSGNEVEVSHNGHLYQWQPIYQSSSNFSFVDGNGPFSAWAMKINGTTTNGSWAYKGMYPVNSTAKTITPPTLTNFAASVTTANCSGTHCVESQGYTASNYNIQRVHVRSNTSDGSNYYQTIISMPRSTQVLMESKYSALAPSSSNRIEIGLGSLSETSSAMTQHFMSNFIDVQNLASGTASNNFDVNGPVIQPSSEKTRYISLMGKTSVTLSNSVN